MCYEDLILTVGDITNLRFIFHQPLKRWLLGEKEGKTKIQKFEDLKNEKSFLDEIKSILHSLLCKSMDWFLYDAGLRHERVKLRQFFPIHP